MRRNETFFFVLLAVIGALLLALMLLIGAWCSLRDAKDEIAAQQELIEDLKARPLTVRLIREEPEPEPEPCPEVDKPAWHDAGEFRIYHYCPCEFCCSKDDGITATGTMATEDTGVHGKTIDLFISNHAQAAAMGTYLTNVKWRESND